MGGSRKLASAVWVRTVGPDGRDLGRSCGAGEDGHAVDLPSAAEGASGRVEQMALGSGGELCGGLVAAGCGGVVAQLAQQEGGVTEGEDVLELGAAPCLGRVAGEIGGPVDEEPVLGLVGEEVAGVHLGVHGGEQVEHALVHALQIIQRAGVHVVLGESGDPQRGVAGDGVDVVTGGAVVQQVGERVFHQEAVGEDVVDDAAGDVQIAGPASAVALGRVPDAVLHAEMRGVGPGLPDFVEQWVGGLEAAAVGDGIEDGVELDGADLDRPRRGEEATRA